MNTDHRFFHDKEQELAAWQSSQPLPKVMRALTLVDTLMQWDSAEKATRWEEIRWTLQASFDKLAPNEDLYADTDHQPGNKDDTWVEDVAFDAQRGLIVLVRFLDDYTFRVPVWCTYFIHLK